MPLDIKVKKQIANTTLTHKDFAVFLNIIAPLFHTFKGLFAEFISLDI